jgi:hypothetical protein
LNKKGENMNKPIKSILFLVVFALFCAACGEQRVGEMSSSYEGRTKIVLESSTYSSDNALVSLGFGGFNFTTYNTIKLTPDSPLPDCNLAIGGQIEDGKANYFVSGSSAYKGDNNDGLGCMGEVEKKQMKRVEVTGGKIENDKTSGDVTLIVYYKPKDSEGEINYEMHMTAHKKGWF